MLTRSNPNCASVRPTKHINCSTLIYCHIACEHIHVDTSIYDELINSANARFIVNNNKWLIINMQYIWEFLPRNLIFLSYAQLILRFYADRVKFIKRAEIPTNEANNRLFQAVSDTDRHQVIFLGISAFYVLDTGKKSDPDAHPS